MRISHEQSIKLNGAEIVIMKFFVVLMPIALIFIIYFILANNADTYESRQKEIYFEERDMFGLKIFTDSTMTKEIYADND